MVGEAHAYVQGESLKACAALLTEAFQLPDHQSGGEGKQLAEDRLHHCRLHALDENGKRQPTSVVLYLRHLPEK